MITVDLDRLRGPILRAVSRSFYLSLRLLPEALRDPVSLAYLLARATDTIADTVGPPVDLRIESFRKLAEAIQGGEAGESMAAIRATFVSRQTDEAEQTLMDALPSIVEWLESLGNGDRTEVRAVLREINRGQLLDLQRFGSGDGIHALATATDLDEYIYLVAGSVGKFWTRICFGHIRDLAEKSQTEMEEMGERYGKALQLINIIRDAGRDLPQGRCYFPMEELSSLGLEPEGILNEPEKVEPILRKWGDVASMGLEAGIDYSCAIKNWRVRCASALPALIGARTLALLRSAGSKALKERIKVPRSEIQSMMLWAATPFTSPRSLRKKYQQLCDAR